jgi:recombination protein RecR
MASVLTPSVDALVAELARLPGIGPRSAQRLAFHLLRAPSERPRALAEAIAAVVDRITPCTECFSFAEGGLCPVCADTRRDPTVICVVEEPSAIISIERTHEFRGRYHVLGGALSPIDGVDPEDLRIAELDQRIERDGVTELVIATNPTMAGEATALFLADRVRGRLRVTRLASGLPVGADLEHADELTLGRALLGRREI